MTKALWPHQKRAVQLSGIEFSRGALAVCVVMPTGAGKTVTAQHFTERHLNKKPDGQVLFLAHREELVSQTFDTFSEAGLSSGVIQSKPTREVNPYRPVQIASIQTLLARKHFPDASLVVYDECFVAGTLVDGIAIETLKAGDIVSCFDHSTHRSVSRPVVAVMKNRPTSLVRVLGITCTPNHPFYVPGEGYVEACRLEGKSVLRYLRIGEPQVPEDMQYALLAGDAIADDAAHQFGTQPSGVSPRTDARRSESNEQPGTQGCCDGNAKEDGTQASYSRREWETSPSASASTTGEIPDGYSGVCFGDREGRPVPRLCKQLQGGPRLPGSEARGRDRRFVSFAEGAPGARPQEGGFLTLQRVERVEILEPGSDGTFGGLCPDGHVYNLEVAEHHNYFVDGFLVHNCHHAPSDLWETIPLEYRRRRVPLIGLTATPIRADGRGFEGLMDALVCPITMRQLIDQGFLVPYTLVDPGRILGSDEIAQDPWKAYLEHADGRKAIVFAGNVKAGRLFTEQFNRAGIPAAFVWGDMPAFARRQTLEDYKNGDLRVLVNVGVLTEGFDDRTTSCVILARSIGSLSLYLQMVGRGLRCSPETGKRDCIIIDLHGTCQKPEFGEPADEREWTLEGEGIRRKALEKPTERFCIVCKVLLDSSSGTVCELCGIARPEAAPPDVLNVKLVKYAAKLREPEEVRKQYFEKLKGIAKVKNYSKWQPHAKYKAIYGVSPPREWW